MVGAVWVFFIGQALPETVFNPAYDLTVALMGFFGGFGTLAGPVLGALILEPVQQEILQSFPNGYLGQIVLGGLFLLVILFLPRGLLPTGGEWMTSLRAWRERRSQPPAGAGAAAPVTTPPEVKAGTPEHSGLPGAGGTR
jgi:branched-chain amino acid transport system permease protein